MKHYHFIAIGGAAMHNLALALHLKGYTISGSDDEIFEPARSRLAQYNLLPGKEGWFPEKLHGGLDGIILGMHARADNPELLQAKKLGIRIYSYPEFLYEQSRDKIRIVIGGSHGKTTITGIILHAMKARGIETDYMVGAKLEGFDVMVRLSETAKYMVFEGDEYLTSPIDLKPKFHWYHPHIALLSGIAWDHINVFPTFENYLDQFRIFIRLVENPGSLVYCESDPILKEICLEEGMNLDRIPYQALPTTSRHGKNYVQWEGKEYVTPLFGKHNMMNLMGAMLVCKQIGIGEHDFLSSMHNFVGAANRLEKVAENENVSVYKDFAHAPSKVMATVQAVREQFPGRKMIACLELHTFSSLNHEFLAQYAACLDAPDQAFVYYNPHALALKKLPDLDEEMILKGFRRSDLHVCNNSSVLHEKLLAAAEKNSVLLLMSSGNYDGMNIADFAQKYITSTHP
jgi:UDP-N-acetylmuramate: L-alanyl-gamma-D-glutamyl-meso-diaminopimelate ligase